MQTPILVLGYNRPKLIENQLNYLLKKIGAKKVYVSLDGFADNAESKKKVLAAQRIVLQKAKKYKSALHYQFLKKNNGCQMGVEKGINWFFSQVDDGIILEDDCIAHPDFFTYCTKLLQMYKDDSRIGMIGGTNLEATSQVDTSYFFSHQSVVWGWATWATAWEDYKISKRDGLNALSKSNVVRFLLKNTTKKHLKVIEKVLEGKIDTWDYIWYLTNLLMNRYCIIPSKNLVSNVGFSADATHTKIRTSQAEMPQHELPFPLKHPTCFITNQSFEEKYLQKIYTKNLVLDAVRVRLGL